MILLKQNSITCHINLMRSIWILLVCLYLICKLIWFDGCLYKRFYGCSCKYKEWSLRLVSWLYLFTFYPLLPVLLLPTRFLCPFSLAATTLFSLCVLSCLLFVFSVPHMSEILWCLSFSISISELFLKVNVILYDIYKINVILYYTDNNTYSTWITYLWI